MAEHESNIIDSNELARRLDMSPVTPRIWRSQDRGPPFIKVPDSSSVRYLWSDVLAWLKQGHTIPGESEGMRMMRLRAKGGEVERVEYDSAKHKVGIPADQIREHVQRERGARS